MEKVTLQTWEKLKDSTCILVFSNEHCASCILLKEELETIENEMNITIYYMDVNEEKNCTEVFDFMIIPTIQLYHLGKCVKRIEGYYPYKTLELYFLKLYSL